MAFETPVNVPAERVMPIEFVEQFEDDARARPVHTFG
jgi:hypothetical protein